MTQTVSINKKVYSVDMMHAYINIFKPKITSVKLDDINFNYDSKVWDDYKGGSVSPNEVILNPDKYPEHKKRVEDADLKYPIILSDNTVIDGLHRLVKSHLLNKKKIKVINFDSKLLNKFLLNEDGNHDVDYPINVYIEVFYKNFS